MLATDASQKSSRRTPGRLDIHSRGATKVSSRDPLLSSGSRLLTFVAPLLWMSGRPGVRLLDFWLASVVSTALQAVMNLLLLRALMRQKLGPA